MVCNVCGARRTQPLFVKNGEKLVRCSDCGFVFVEPRSDRPQPLAELYRDPGYFGGGDYYLDYRGHEANYRRLARRVVEAVSLERSGGRWLDVGCAAGFLLDEARRRGFSVQGVELSPAMAEHARGLGLEVFVGTLADAALSAESLDVISFCDSLEHVEDPGCELTQAHRLLAPGGLVVIQTPNVESFLAHAFGRRWPHFTPPEHVVYFSRSTLSRLLARSGFIVRRATRLGHWFSIGEILAKFVPGVRPLARKLGMPVYLDVGDLFVIADKR